MVFAKLLAAGGALMFVGGAAARLRPVHDHIAVAPALNITEMAAMKPMSPSPPSLNSNFTLCTAEDLRPIGGYLLDLDGTMYSPAGLLPGVVDFFDWLEQTGTPHVLLSNGFKTKEGVASKFAMKKYLINQKVDPQNVHTAGIAVANYMVDHVPKGAKIFAVGTGITYSDGETDFLTRILKRTVPAELFDTWNVRTDMNLTEIYQWAAIARAAKEEPVYVVQAFMGAPNDTFGDDPVTGKSGYNTLDYALLCKMNVLLRNGAHYLVGAPDVADSQPKSEIYPDIDTAWPTMGGVEAMLLTSSEMFPGTERAKKHANVGKGGNQGAVYMMEPGIELLLKQQPNLQRKNMMMIGDNFGTDIKAANDVGVASMLVLVGAHQVEDAKSWSSRPTCYLDHVGQIPKILNTA